MTRHHDGESVRPIDIEIGGDDDMPGIAQELTIDDIDDIAFDASLSAADRQEQLNQLLQDIRSRRAADYMGDMNEIASHLNDRLAALGNPMESQTILESTGMDPDDRSDDDDPADHIDDETPDGDIAS
jgi:hypothetical protein